MSCAESMPLSAVESISSMSRGRAKPSAQRNPGGSGPPRQEQRPCYSCGTLLSAVAASEDSVPTYRHVSAGFALDLPPLRARRDEIGMIAFDL